MSISSDVRFTARTQAENEIRIKIWNRIGKRTDDVVIKYVNNNISYNLFDKVILLLTYLITI